jgi:hypothetical protein
VWNQKHAREEMRRF